jgi:hypothetical protein
VLIAVTEPERKPSLAFVTGLFAWAIGALSDIRPLVLFLAYSPGGIAEMGMVALALNLDTALVVTHHVARIFMVGFGGPLFFQLARAVRHPHAKARPPLGDGDRACPSRPVDRPPTGSSSSDRGRCGRIRRGR